MAKDYAKGRVRINDGCHSHSWVNVGIHEKKVHGWDSIAALLAPNVPDTKESRKLLEEYANFFRVVIREACAEAIRDTKRSERRRAARIVRDMIGPQGNGYLGINVAKAILGKKGAKNA